MQPTNPAFPLKKNYPAWASDHLYIYLDLGWPRLIAPRDLPIFSRNESHVVYRRVPSITHMPRPHLITGLLPPPIFRTKVHILQTSQEKGKVKPNKQEPRPRDTATYLSIGSYYTCTYLLGSFDVRVARPGRPYLLTYMCVATRLGHFYLNCTY